MLGEVDCVAAHLGQDVLSQDDDLPGRILHPARVCGECAVGHSLSEVLCDVVAQWRSFEQGGS